MRVCLSVISAAVLGCLIVGNAEASINYSVAGSTYTQNFDSLPSSQGPTAALPVGWEANGSNQVTPLFVSTGSGTSGGVYSFGAAGSGERALGSIASNTTGPITYGVRFVNTTGTTLNSFAISYVGEQWRDNGNSAAHSLTVDYQLDGGSFNAVPSLEFVSPKHSGSSAALNGNDPTNRTSISYTLTNLLWQDGDELFLRWTDANNSGTDHALAIDDFDFSANFTAVVPEPVSLLVWGGVGLIGIGVAIYKKKVA